MDSHLAPTPCTLTIYASDARRLFGGREGPDSRDAFGHAFLALTDADGTRRVFGFHARTFLLGADKVAPEDAIRGWSDLLKNVAGMIRDDSDREWDEAQAWPVTQDQHDRMLAEARRWQAAPPRFSLHGNNCSSFVTRVAEAGGLDLPSCLYLLPTPSGIVHGLRLLRIHGRIQARVDKVLQGLSDIFNGRLNRRAGPPARPPAQKGPRP